MINTNMPEDFVEKGIGNEKLYTCASVTICGYFQLYGYSFNCHALILRFSRIRIGNWCVYGGLRTAFTSTTDNFLRRGHRRMIVSMGSRFVSSKFTISSLIIIFFFN